MNKSELIEHIAKQADISKAAATRALDAIVGGVKTTLKKSGSVTIVGFGTFAVTKRAARTGRNPRTGAAIKIKAAKVPKFRPGPVRRQQRRRQHRVGEQVADDRGGDFETGRHIVVLVHPGQQPPPGGRPRWSSPAAGRRRP